MPSGSRSLGKVAATYVASLSQDERSAIIQVEVNHFVRWYGADRPIERLAPPDLESYVEWVEKSGAAPDQRLEPLRAFLLFARKEGHFAENLASHVKIRRQVGRKSQVASPLAEDPTIEMTAEGHARLQSELAGLIGQRPLIAEELARARADKDFRENAPLDAAREHQGQVEARIREIQATLRFAAVVDDRLRALHTRAAIGSVVVVRDLEDDEDLTFTLVSPSEVNLKQGRISVASPLGRAILDHEAGDEIAVEAPAGVIRYRVEEVRE